MNAIDRAKKYWWVIAAIILAVIVIVFFTSCGGGSIIPAGGEYEDELEKQFTNSGIAKQFRNFKHTYTTPKGQIIKSTVPVPAQFLDYADEGGQKQIDRFARLFPAYTLENSLQGQRIYLIDPNVTYEPDGTPSAPCQTEVNDPGAPCIFVTGVKAAGATFGLNSRWDALDLDPPIIMPHQQRQNWTYREWFVNTVHNEREHVQGYMNRHLEPMVEAIDQHGNTIRISLFQYYQGPNDVHPWQWPLVQGFKARTPSACLPE